MKCATCGASPADGVNLYRQNAKGQPGIFACAMHSKPVGDDLVRTVAALQVSQQQRQKNANIKEN